MAQDRIRLNIELPEILHRQFKSLCAARGQTMSEAIIEYIQTELRLGSTSSGTKRFTRGYRYSSDAELAELFQNKATELFQAKATELFQNKEAVKETAKAKEE